MFRSGYAAIIGRPNVGKSTFLNSVLGEKVSIVTRKPQTTRNKIIGIKTLPDAQIIFIDTPGIHKPIHKLGALMVRRAVESLKDIDLVLFMVEPTMPSPADIKILRLIEKSDAPVILLINKVDKIKKPQLLPIIDAYNNLSKFKEIIPISALKGDGIGDVIESVKGVLPEGPKYYPDDLVTEQAERVMVSEIIREKIMSHTEEEVPHSIAVEVISWQELQSGTIKISANIYVEKDRQKPIIIGKRGVMLKKIGIEARKDIERLLATKVFLELWVKVKKLWRQDESAISELGV